MVCKCGCGNELPDFKREGSQFVDKDHKAAYHRSVYEAGKRALGKTLPEIAEQQGNKTASISILENTGKVKQRSHAALIENSKRLQKTLAILNTRGPSTTKQISDFTGSEATHSDIHELRQNGYDITCKYSGRSATGRKIYTYELWKNNA